MKQKITATVYVNASAVLGFISLWYIYRHPWFILVSVVSLLTANFLAFMKHKKNLNWRKFLLLVFINYLLIGAIVAIPSVYGGVNKAGSLIAQVVFGPIISWKQILTLELPLGTYQAVLTPVVVLTLFFVSYPLALFWDSSKHVLLATFLPWTILVVGIIFGSGNTNFFAFEFFSLQLLLGLIAFLITIIFLLLNNGIKNLLAGALILMVGAVVAGFLSPMILTGTVRDVLRTATAPEIKNAKEVRPLTVYRNFFTDEMYEEPLFEVSAATGRLRLAVMDNYDGENLSVTSTVTDEIFVRTPATLSFKNKKSAKTEVKTINWQEIWVPLAGEVSSITFLGENKNALADNFYYHTDSGTGIELSESLIENGMHYVFSYTETTADLKDFEPVLLPESVVVFELESLKKWVTHQNSSKDFQGFLYLVEKLKERGYLSRSFMTDGSPLWAQKLPGYQFQSSRPGHSLGRLDKLFTDLNEKEETLAATQTDLNLAVTDSPNISSEMFVATTGDEEQFATAVKLVADHYGYKSRVVLGINTETCEAGLCRGKDILAWVEIQDQNSGKWAVIDVTPQAKNPPVLGKTEISDPQNYTDAEEEKAEYVPPAPPTPAADQDAAEDKPETYNFQVLLLVIKIISSIILFLLLIGSPFCGIFLYKKNRRNRKKKNSDAQQKIIGGWQEYLNHLIDMGISFPVNKTRKEAADLLTPVNKTAKKLAFLADMADFSGKLVTAEQASQYWVLVENDIEKVVSELQFWQKIKYKFSIRSLRSKKRGGKNESEVYTSKT